MEYFNLISAVIGIAGTFAIIRYQTTENKLRFEKHQEEQGRVISAVFTRLDKYGEDIVALKTKQEANITAKEVHEQYISRELFEMHKQHIDHRFDTLDNRFDKVDSGMGKILDELRDIKKQGTGQ